MVELAVYDAVPETLLVALTEAVDVFVDVVLFE